MHYPKLIKLRIPMTAAVLVAIISVLVFLIVKQAISATALWNIVHERCVPDMRKSGNPSPCVSIDLAKGESGGFAVLKDATGNAQL